MTPQLTLSIVISADGKTATRSGASITSSASPEYQQRIFSQREAADCLLIDTAAPLFPIPDNMPLILFGNSPTWQPVADSPTSNKVVVVDDKKPITAARLHAIAGKLDVHKIHCEPLALLTRDLLKENMVDTLNLTISFSLSGGHAAETLTGNGATSAFVNSHHFSLTSHEQTGKEIHLCYISKAESPDTL